MIPSLTTERLTLRPPCLADVPPYTAIMQSARATHMGGPFSEEDTWLDFCAGVAGWHLRGYGMWSADLSETGEFVGMIFLHRDFGDPENELGWILTEAAEGKGYAVEAALAAREYGYKTLGWETVVSYIDRENQRSIKVAERLDAVIDENAPRTKEHGDCLIYRHPKPEALH